MSYQLSVISPESVRRMVGDALTATNAYAVGTSDDERCSWCGVSPKDLTRHCGWYCSLLKLILYRFHLFTSLF